MKAVDFKFNRVHVCFQRQSGHDTLKFFGKEGRGLATWPSDLAEICNLTNSF